MTSWDIFTHMDTDEVEEATNIRHATTPELGQRTHIQVLPF